MIIVNIFWGTIKIYRLVTEPNTLYKTILMHKFEAIQAFRGSFGEHDHHMPLKSILVQVRPRTHLQIQIKNIKIHFNHLNIKNIYFFNLLMVLIVELGSDSIHLNLISLNRE